VVRLTGSTQCRKEGLPLWRFTLFMRNYVNELYVCDDASSFSSHFLSRVLHQLSGWHCRTLLTWTQNFLMRASWPASIACCLSSMVSMFVVNGSTFYFCVPKDSYGRCRWINFHWRVNDLTWLPSHEHMTSQ